jgi:ribulose-5-phosphate 4-epimerase/fuculose-1-phosphate aldolase
MTLNVTGLAEDPAVAEARVRVELACAYRLAAQFGWHELIYNHITVRAPGTEHFLINPFGLMYREVKASNLVKVDLDGGIIGASAWPINPAGYVLHSAIHGARPDVGSVMHTHSTAGMAVACQKDGLLPLSFPAAFFTGQIAYHDFEGVTLDLDERQRMIANLGDKPVMILRNHGLVSTGRTVADAFITMYNLQRACEVQIAAQAGGAALHLPAPGVAEKVARQVGDGSAQDNALVFAALMRWMDELDPSYRD